MSLQLRSRLWLIAPLCALAFFVTLNIARIGRVAMVTRAGDEPPAVEGASPTGYRGGVRNLIVANHNNQSYQWIAQTQQAAEHGAWRVRFVNYDNAPFGRSVFSPSPYRWWLVSVAWCADLFTATPLPLAIERTAPCANVILFVLALAGSALLISRYFGSTAAAVVSVGFAVTVPVTTDFLGGEPGDFALALIAAWASLLMIVGLLRRQGTVAAADQPLAMDTKWAWVAAGASAGIVLWFNTVVGLIVILGITLGAVLQAIAERRNPGLHVTPESAWTMWAFGGAVAVLFAFFIEYSPDHLGDWHLEFVHPLYGLSWLGLAACLAWAISAIRSGKCDWRFRTLVILGGSIALVVTTVVVAIRTGAVSALSASVSLQPSQITGAVGADSVWSWARRSGAILGLIAVVLPLVAVTAFAIMAIFRRSKAPCAEGLAFILGPTLLLVGFACFRLYWWSVLDLALLALVATLLAPTENSTPRAEQPRPANIWVRWGARAAVIVLIPGAWFLVRISGVGSASDLNPNEATALIERDVSHWLANRAGPNGAVVLAPPNLATSLYYHGGLHVLGTPYWDNKLGMDAAVRLAGASSPDEGLVLAKRRGVNYIVLPSWDKTLDELVRASSPQPEKALLGYLERWQAPRWLRPVPYDMPNIAGFEGQSVAVFQIVDVQDNALALSRLAEYFVETRRIEDAIAVASTLEETFGNDLGGAVARAIVASTIGNADRLDLAMSVITRNLAHADLLAWDQRVSLAIALAQARRFDLAREQLQQCVAKATEDRLRFLTTASLYRFELLCKINRLELPDPALASLARQLLPPEFRSRI